MKRARILVVDDKGTFLALFRRILPADTELVCASSGARALELLDTQSFDVVVSDVRMPGGADGIDVLKKVRESSEETAVVLMTAYGTIAEAVLAMKFGADDYLTKPFDPDDALTAIERAIERRRARGMRLVTHVQPPLLGESPAMVVARDLVSRAARSEANVLICGETGTGKDLAASLIHEEGRRRARPLVTHVSRLSSEHRLQVDFEHGEGGTLYLDEVFDMPATVQTRLLKLLDQRAGDPSGACPRIIAGTSAVRAAGGGGHRVELEARLEEIRINLPPLRERREDIPLLSTAFLARMPDREGFARVLSSEALDALVAHEWPGNVRQLETTLLAATSVAIDAAIHARDLPTAVGGRGSTEPQPPLTSLTYREVLAVGRERATREYLVAIMTAVAGNVTQAAERAGVERETFHRLLKRYGVRAEDFRTRS